MTPRRYTLLAMLAGTALIAAPVWSGHDPRFIWNASASLPVGLYAIAPAEAIAVSDIAIVMPPDPLAGFLVERGYLARGVPLLKRVLALSGETVCRRERTIIAYEVAYGVARERDRLGRSLPDWQGCRTLRADEAFLMNWDAPDSFDSRYFGPLPASTIVGRAIPLWTDEDGSGRFAWRAAGTVTPP